MSVSVVTNTEPKNANIFATAALGGAVGGAIRYFKPVTKQEIDTVLFGESDIIRQNSIRQARKSATNDIVKMFSKNRDNKAFELFMERAKASVKYANAKEAENATARREAVKLATIAKDKIKAAPASIQKEIKSLTQIVINKVKAARVLSENALKDAVKQARPWPAYILPGVALGALFAYFYNVVGTISKD